MSHIRQVLKFISPTLASLLNASVIFVSDIPVLVLYYIVLYCSCTLLHLWCDVDV